MSSSFINDFLKTKHLNKHDGRPLWKYNLSRGEYTELKKCISQISSNWDYYDPRDITMFFAEWWKNEYNGGILSIEDVFESVKGCKLPLDDFYKAAQKGAVLLGIKWIKRANILKFRTLLLQGGLPINHLLNHSGVYTNFLKKVLEIRPTTIDEFAYEDDIVRILPSSSRNEAIYESCLQIVQAIWSGNEEYLSIFENNTTTNASFKSISDELKKHKTAIENTVKKRSKFRAFWVLHKKENSNEIYLEFNFPDIIEENDFRDLLFKNIKDNVHIELKVEYQLIINDLLICKFKKNLKGNYKIFRFSDTNILWNGEETKPEIYLLSNDGAKFDFPISLIDYPKITEPTLWTQKTENEWILNKGTHCKQLEAIIIFSNKWRLKEELNISELILKQQVLNWARFEGDIQIYNGSEQIEFKTNAASFDWLLVEEKPEWILRSNIPVVRNWPKIAAFNADNEQINDIILSWRMFGGIIWNKWNNGILPQGYIEYRIEALGLEEKDSFFNLGALDLAFMSRTPNDATIEIKRCGDLILNAKEGQSLTLKQCNNLITATLEDIQKTPKSIKAVVRNSNQNRSLQLEILPPFRGVKLFKPNGSILDNEALLYGNFTGYRIISSLHNNTTIRYYICLYNTNDDSIKISRELPNNITPLRKYEEIVFRLFQLTNTMDKSSSVTIELLDYVDDKKNCYLVQNYNKNIIYYYEDDRLKINIEGMGDEIELFAIPVDCQPHEIELIALSKDNGVYSLPENISLKKFIIFSELNNINYRLLPCLVSSSEDIQHSPIEKKAQRNERVNNYTAELLSESVNGDCWEKLKKYYHISINREIPFSTFDILCAAGSTPELSAKLFCYLCVYNEDPNFIDKTSKELENDLGFCFHWIPKDDWAKAIDWICDSFPNEELLPVIGNNILDLIKDNDPMIWFDKIADYSVNNNSYTIEGFMRNVEVSRMRQLLNEKVMNELPKTCPKVPDNFKHILPVDSSNAIVKLLLKVPMAVALSISGIDKNIWGDDEKSKIIRRNIQYAQWVAPEWYCKAIVYCLSKLKN